MSPLLGESSFSGVVAVANPDSGSVLGTQLPWLVLRVPVSPACSAGPLEDGGACSTLPTLRGSCVSAAVFSAVGAIFCATEETDIGVAASLLVACSRSTTSEDAAVSAGLVVPAALLAGNALSFESPSGVDDISDVPRSPSPPPPVAPPSSDGGQTCVGVSATGTWRASSPSCARSTPPFSASS
ncbi:unnamed protein product [Ectocarpus sp. 12 AP-2014]